MRGTETTGYRERLRVPLRWWAQGTMLIATFWLAMVVAIPDPPELPWILTGVLLLLQAAFLRSYGGAEVRVVDGWLRAGNARIEVEHLGTAEALEAAEADRVAGRDADARAYLLLRPYVRRAVRVPIDDPADPAPYWLISSRHPRALAGAVNAARASAGAAEADATER